MDAVLKLPEGEDVATFVNVVIAKSGKVFVFGPTLEQTIVVPGSQPLMNTDLWLDILLAGIKTTYMIAFEQAKIIIPRKKKVILESNPSDGSGEHTC